MTALFRSFATAPDAPRLESPSEIDRLYRRNRIRVMLAITAGYGLIYTCRLAIGVVKKPMRSRMLQMLSRSRAKT